MKDYIWKSLFCWGLAENLKRDFTGTLDMQQGRLIGWEEIQ